MNPLQAKTAEDQRNRQRQPAGEGEGIGEGELEQDLDALVSPAKRQKRRTSTTQKAALQEVKDRDKKAAHARELMLKAFELYGDLGIDVALVAGDTRYARPLAVIGAVSSTMRHVLRSDAVNKVIKKNLRITLPDGQLKTAPVQYSLKDLIQMREIVKLYAMLKNNLHAKWYHTDPARRPNWFPDRNNTSAWWKTGEPTGEQQWMVVLEEHCEPQLSTNEFMVFIVRSCNQAEVEYLSIPRGDPYVPWELNMCRWTKEHTVALWASVEAQMRASPLSDDLATLAAATENALNDPLAAVSATGSKQSPAPTTEKNVRSMGLLIADLKEQNIIRSGMSRDERNLTVRRAWNELGEEMQQKYKDRAKAINDTRRSAADIRRDRAAAAIAAAATAVAADAVSATGVEAGATEDNGVADSTAVDPPPKELRPDYHELAKYSRADLECLFKQWVSWMQSKEVDSDLPDTRIDLLEDADLQALMSATVSKHPADVWVATGNDVGEIFREGEAVQVRTCVEDIDDSSQGCVIWGDILLIECSDDENPHIHIKEVERCDNEQQQQQNGLVNTHYQHAGKITIVSANDIETGCFEMQRYLRSREV